MHTFSQIPSGAAVRRQAILLLATAAILSAQTPSYNKNLVVNGDAEAGPAAQQATDAKVGSIPNWTTTGGFSVGTYGGGNFPSTGDFLPASHGNKLFYGGPGSVRATAVQTVDISNAATDIDAGRVKFNLSGFLGFIGGSYDTINVINLKADFLDASGAVLLTATALGPASADIHVAAGLLPRGITGFLPAKVRSAKVTIDLGVGQSGYNGYAADNISLVLNTDPILSTNLLINGNGETDPQSDNGYPVPGWNADTSLLVWKWGDYKMPSASDSGPSDRGKYFFACPNDNSQCRAYQRVDFSTASKLVDAGKVTYTLSGWFGGDASFPDTADATVTFYDASLKVIGTAVRIGPVSQSDRNFKSGLLQRSTTATVPAGARLAEINLYFHKSGSPSENTYAYADSLNFQLDSIQIAGVVNAASAMSGPVAPGEYVTIYGSSLGPIDPVLVQGMQKGAGGATVTFNGVEAYLTFVYANQINAIVPYGITGKADAVVQYNGKSSDPFPLQIAPSSPGIFTQQYGAGQAWAVNNDYTFNSSSKPVARGGWISFWATGQGLVSPDGKDGESISGYKNVLLPVKVTIGGYDAPVIGAAALIYTGEIQVNVSIPNSVPAGDAELVLTIGGASSRKGVTINVK